MKKVLNIWKPIMLAFMAFTVSCSSSDDNDGPTPPEPDMFGQGVFILNQGNFGTGNSSVSFYSQEGELTNDIFVMMNGRTLGDTGQSMYFDDENAYFVMNGSNTVEAVNRRTFKSLGTVSSGLSNPRYMTVANNRGYVSNWGDGMDEEDDFIAVIDLDTYQVTATIPVAEGPEMILSKANRLYVAHAGGFGYGNSVSIINTDTNTLISEIEVGDVPESMVEFSGRIYVLSSGKAAWTGDETAGQLDVIDMVTQSVTTTLPFPMGQHPTLLTNEGNRLYWTEGTDVYTSPMNPTSLPGEPLLNAEVDGGANIYGLGVHKSRVYVADAGDFNSMGTVNIFFFDGSVYNTLNVGYLPTAFYFND